MKLSRAAPHACTASLRRLVLLACASALVLPATGALAWVYPEHRDIAVVALQSLPSDRLALITQLWSTARTGHESRLCPRPAEVGQGRRPECIDFAALPAIAGDHSCSPRDMIDSVLRQDWMLKVADVSARLKEKLARAKRRDERVNAIRNADIDLQRADRDYATRAGANNVHFLLPRPSVGTTLDDYGRMILGLGAELNGVGAYAWFHVRALDKAARATGATDPALRSQLTLAAFADEAFALHFLQDAFAAGHVAGSWGDVAGRKGTHDYYNERGLETVTFAGERVVLLGDAHMRPEDAERAGKAVRTSLEQLLDAFAGVGSVPRDAGDAMATAAGPDDFDVCREARFERRVASIDALRAMTPVLVQTPLPALAAGIGELPRFRAEIGPFIGMSAGARASTVYGGFGAGQTDVGGSGGLDLAVRAGLGLDGVLNESGDGLVFGELGVRQDAVTRTLACTQSQACATSGEGATVVPSRSAITLRLRVPFWLVPGDLVLAAPVLALASPKTLERMAVQAGNGGLIPWQSGMSTPIGRFQFVLGREVGLSFYGYNGEDVVGIPAGATVTDIRMRSMQVEFPVVEYRPFRSFSVDQSSGLLVQFYVGFDRPLHRETVAPGAPLPELRTVPMAGLRVVFDWRSYFR